MASVPKILIVEDEAIIAFQLKIHLSREGFEVCDTVGTAEQSVQSARQFSPDLILMDIHLRGKITGIEAMQEIRTFSQAPVIFMTGYPNEEVKDSAIRFQPADYLVKPIGSVALVKAIERWVGGSEQ
jgi:DNA-binding response OmpR family regulator